MTGCQNFFLLLLSFIGSLHFCCGISLSKGVEDIRGEVPGLALFISVAAILLLAYVVIGCVCCPNRSIKALSYQNGGFPVSRLNENLQFENGSEFAIFPPHSAVIDMQPVACFEDKVTFEPLPDILPRKLSGQSAACSSRPSHFRTLLKNKVSLHDWFDDPNSNFPRDQLQYLKELGCGWFGRVVEGEAVAILGTEDRTAVVVKILREEASPSEHLHFLHEIRPYRDLSHPNVLRLLGRCLESDPFLLIIEHSINDLKSHLIQQDNKEALVKNGSVLQMACNVAAGLRHMHDNGYTHLDLAAHNCFVSKDSTVKIGDYGISFERWRGDYYCLGDIALPIRWCSPEMLLCSDTSIETKEVSKEANIWAFGVIVWEIFEFGKLPYEELTNQEVLQKVLIDHSTQLPLPSFDFPVKEEISMIMKECWKAAHLRPPMEKLESFLTRLYNDRHNIKTLENSFEERWNALQPKPLDGLKLDFSERSGNSDGFSSFEASFDLLAKNSQLSPSLRVLNGSIDELTDNSVSFEKSANDVASITSDLPQLEEDPIRLQQVTNDINHLVSETSVHQILNGHANKLKEVDNSNQNFESTVLDIENQNVPSPLPSIVIHRSPIVKESLHDENENVVDDLAESSYRGTSTPKPFRFVFKEESAAEANHSSKMSTEGTSEEFVHSQLFTSTPIKSTDSNGVFEDSTGSVTMNNNTENEDVASKLTLNRDGCTSSGDSQYYDAPSHKMETSLNSFFSATSMIAQSNVDYNISKNIPGDLIGVTETSSKPKDTVLEESTFLETESSNVDRTELFPEGSPFMEYGEPVTPEVSINISSCSYSNECRNISPTETSQEMVQSPALQASSGAVESRNKHSYLDSSSSDLLDSFSDSFPQEKRDPGNFRTQKCPVDFSSGDAFYSEDDLENDSECDAYKSKGSLRLQPYDEVIVEDLETGEQTVITEGYSACDDYENSVDSDEILKINIETDEAIIVDSSEALIGFVPSRSIEMLQECEILPNLNSSFRVEDEKESSESNHFDVSNSTSSSPAAHQSAASSPCESPDSTYPLHQPYRNFSLQNEVIEEEITDEILSPSSIHSTASFSSNDIFLGEKMSEGSEGFREEDACETSVMPSVDHFFEESDDGSKTDASYSEGSPLNVATNNAINNLEYTNGNDHSPKDNHSDVMYSWQPTQSVRWHSDETLDIGDDSVVLEGREILAGGVLETHGMSVKDFTTALNRLDVEDCRALDRLSLSPYSSVESSPCRDAYTPDFESDSEGSGTSCSSTSGSFECINNKFKDSMDVSRIPASEPASDESREQSPLKVFSKTWDCHATPTKGLLLTPEKKLCSMRKSVSFHEEDPQVVFEYPPASDSSEDGANEPSLWNTDYQNYADWELQAGENDEVLEIEELEFEPYVRRPTTSRGPMSRPMLYSLTSGFSDDEDSLPESFAPSNSPEEGNPSKDEISQLIRTQLNNLALEENRLKWMQDVLESQASACEQLQHDSGPAPTEELSTNQKCSEVDAAPQDTTPLSSILDNCMDQELSSQTDSFQKEDPSAEDNVTKSLAENASEANCITQVKNMISVEHTFLVNPELEWELHEPISTENENSPALPNAVSQNVPDAADTTLSENMCYEISPLALEEGNMRPKHKGPSKDDEEQEVLDSTRSESRTLVDISSTTKCKTNSAEFKNKESVASDCENNIRLDEQPKGESLQKDHEAEAHQSLSSEYVEDLCKITDSDNCAYKSDCSDANENYSDDISLTVEHVDNKEGFCLLPETKIAPTESETIQCLDTVSNKTNTVDEALLPETLVNCSAKQEATDRSHDTDIRQALDIGKSPKNTDSGEVASTDNLMFITHESGQDAASCRKNVVDNAPQENLMMKQPLLANTTDPLSVDINVTQCETACNGPLISTNKDAIDSCTVQESALISRNEGLQPKESVPKIIITPASESEFEDELEEYLCNQLRQEEDFSVTPQYTVQPFEDVFGSFGVPGTSSDYTEAFNFEFDGGDFFDDLIDDYPNEVNRGHWDDFPSMTEKTRSEDSKCDSSPLYYTSSDATHL